MEMNATEWLNKELRTAAAEWQRAAADSEMAGFDLASRELSKYQRDYWSGYRDAITNALNELAGPGDVN